MNNYCCCYYFISGHCCCCYCYCYCCYCFNLVKSPVPYTQFIYYISFSPKDGTYHSLTSLQPEKTDQLLSEHVLFPQPLSAYAVSAGLSRDWPDARGIWFTKDKRLFVWVNEEDHARIISMETGGNMERTYER